MTRIAEQQFPGVFESAGAARRFMAGQVTDQPAAQAAALCVAELAGNAIRHSRSGDPGGTFTVRVEVAATWVHVEVADQGGPGTPTVRDASADADGGRGLSIVAALATDWGVVPHCGGHRVWARCDRSLVPRPRTAAPLTAAVLAVAP